MTRHRSAPSALDEGKALARELFDLSPRELESLGGERRDDLRTRYARLSDAQFEDVLSQVRESKLMLHKRVGWQAIPHDISVLVLVLAAAFFDLRIAIIACIAVLVLLEGIFQFTYNERLYQPLSALVWLTYPAYLVFGYLLYRMGYSIVWIAVGVLLAALGTYVLGVLSRLPVRLILESRARGRQAGLAKRQEREKEADR
jgi:hypothetical protein